MYYFIGQYNHVFRFNWEPNVLHLSFYFILFYFIYLFLFKIFMFLKKSYVLYKNSGDMKFKNLCI